VDAVLEFYGGQAEGLAVPAAKPYRGLRDRAGG